MNHNVEDGDADARVCPPSAGAAGSRVRSGHAGFTYVPGGGPRFDAFATDDFMAGVPDRPQRRQQTFLYSGADFRGTASFGQSTPYYIASSGTIQPGDLVADNQFVVLSNRPPIVTQNRSRGAGIQRRRCRRSCCRPVLIADNAKLGAEACCFVQQWDPRRVRHAAPLTGQQRQLSRLRLCERGHPGFAWQHSSRTWRPWGTHSGAGCGVPSCVSIQPLQQPPTGCALGGAPDRVCSARACSSTAVPPAQLACLSARHTALPRCWATWMLDNRTRRQARRRVPRAGDSDALPASRQAPNLRSCCHPPPCRTAPATSTRLLESYQSAEYGSNLCVGRVLAWLECCSPHDKMRHFRVPPVSAASVTASAKGS
jgi:hypothetical protein